MTALLKWLLIILGAVVMAIGASNIFLGPQTVGNFFAWLVGMFVQASPIVEGFDDANTDSEFRFYSVMFTASGLLLVWIAKHLNDQMHLVPMISAIFFLGGLARLITIGQVGWPHPVFSVLMAIELIAPALVVLIWLFARKREA